MNSLTAKIAQEIRRRGPISFARYMEMALYEPELGYYERQRAIGRRGDFYTSVSVGPLFGGLLAFQFGEWLAAGDGSGIPQIFEAGAHDGTLAADILQWFERERPELFQCLEYGLIEPSKTHRAWQEEKLHSWAPKLKWFDGVGEIPSASTPRILFSNELLDAMPVRRLAWNSTVGKWEEYLVDWEKGSFGWRRGAPLGVLPGFITKIKPEILEVLPDGYVVEHSPDATAWWTAAARAIGRGKLLTADYGYSAADRLRPGRNAGTLRTFSQHHGAEDLLRNPGDVDITAHVDFSAIETAGWEGGFVTEAFVEQGRFLTQIVARMPHRPWSPAETKQFQTLTHPEHLGRAFRVLVQSRP